MEQKNPAARKTPHLPATLRLWACLWCLPALPATALSAPTLVLSLVASNYNGYNISCFGMKDGGIDLSVAGGTAPYHYEWSNGATTQDVFQLAAGYYRVRVIDAYNETATAEITLDQPLPMKLDVDVYEYANGYNISCYECNNGNASVVVLGGAAPFAVTWSDGPTGMERYNLGPRDYKITVADANGCGSASTTIYLRGPARSDWSMAGNANTLPGQQYVGTPDNKDLVLKTNGQERLRLKAGGQIALWGADTTAGLLYRDHDGTLKIGPADDPPDGPCFMLLSMPYWKTKGNNFGELCPTEPRPILGTLSNDHLPIYTNGVERMRLTRTGRFGIGTIVPAQKFEVHHTDTRGGMLLANELAGNAHSEIRFNQGTTQRWGLGCDLAALGDQDFFLWDDVAGEVRMYMDENGKLGLGTTLPKGNFHVRSPGPTKAVVSASNAENAETWVYNSNYGYGLRVDPAGMGRIMYNFNDPSTAISITKEGKVGIGYDPPSPGGPLYKFYVDGGIACRDVKVTIEEFQDKVFAKDHALMPLPDLRAYLEQHGHLPTMPKGSDVEAAGGMEVGDLQMRLLRTVEEQALYILDLQAQVDELKQQIKGHRDGRR